MPSIALISDIHGNLTALDAVLADIAATGAEATYCFGDLVGYGPDPAGVIDRVRELGIPTVRGNYDDGVGNRRGECGCYYATEQARADGAASYAFTDAALDDARAAWLAALPGEIRIELDDLRVLLVHGSPRKINEYLGTDRDDAFLARLAVGADADVICVGHTHVPYDRTVAVPGGAPVRFVNAGSVGKPKDGDPRACWTELAFGPAPGELAVAVHRVAYDVATVQAAMLDAGLPETLAAALASA